MNKFYIIHSKDHDSFKESCKQKKGTIVISYVDLLSQQEKYILYDEPKNNTVLECELFNKIYNSIYNLKNPKYHSVYYYTDTLDSLITSSFIDSLLEFKDKTASDFTIAICNLDNNESCQKRLTKLLKNIKKNNIEIVNKDCLHQTF